MAGQSAFKIHLYAKESSFFRARAWLSSDLKETRALVQVFGFGLSPHKEKWKGIISENEP
jgi:hypothetical protein